MQSRVSLAKKRKSGTAQSKDDDVSQSQAEGLEKNKKNSITYQTKSKREYLGAIVYKPADEITDDEDWRPPTSVSKTYTADQRYKPKPHFNMMDPAQVSPVQMSPKVFRSQVQLPD